MICHEPATEVELLLSLGNDSKHRVGEGSHRYLQAVTTVGISVPKDGQTVHLHPVLFPWITRSS